MYSFFRSHSIGTVGSTTNSSDDCDEFHIGISAGTHYIGRISGDI